MKTYNFEISEIANKFGANVQESTCERNGYPSCIRPCIFGFDTLSEAEQAADELKSMINDSEVQVDVQHFIKRDGWNLWYRTGNNAYQMYDMTSELRDSQIAYNAAQAEDWLAERAERIEDENYLDYLGITLEQYNENTKKVYNAIKDLMDNQIIVVDSDCYDGYIEIMESKAIAYHEDVYTYAIGISINW